LRRRPHYTAIERLRILGRPWLVPGQAARIFLLDEQTVLSWLGRVDEEGAGALVRVAAPVNKFAEFVRYLVMELKALLPAIGEGAHCAGVSTSRVTPWRDDARADAEGAGVGAWGSSKGPRGARHCRDRGRHGNAS
jgi:hypothetical protein